MKIPPNMGCQGFSLKRTHTHTYMLIDGIVCVSSHPKVKATFMWHSKSFSQHFCFCSYLSLARVLYASISVAYR